MIGGLGPVRRIVESPRYKWWAYVALGTGMFLAVMDQASLAIALPRIADHFQADIPTVQWVTLSYVLSTSVVFMPSGRLSDMIGRKPVYVAGLLIFVGGAALAGSAPTLPVLLIAKVIQGVGSACIQANGMAIVTEVFPARERGKALGLYMMIIGVGLIAGPLVGGTLVSSLGWRAVFFASVPVGAVAVGAAMAVFSGGRPSRSVVPRFDWAGAALSAWTLAAFLLTMTSAYRLGWGSTGIVIGFIATAALLAGFVWWELRASDPMLDLSFFKSRVFSIGVGARFLSFISAASVNFLMPFYLVQGLGYKTSIAGLLMVPAPVFMAIMSPIAGRLSDKVGTRWPSVVAAALSASAMFTFSRLSLDSSPVHVVVGMMLLGAGAGSFTATNTSGVMSSQQRAKYGIVSAFLNVTRTSADLTGIAIATTIVALTMTSLGQEPSLAAVADAGGDSARAAFVAGMRKAFLVAGSCLVLASALSVVRGREGPAQEEAHGSAQGVTPLRSSEAKD